jgi:hypothetical protein
MAHSKRDVPVADKAPTGDALTSYDNYPCSQHVSCSGGRMQRVDLFHLSATRRDETDSGILVGRDGAMVIWGGSFPAINFECWG